MHVLFTVKVLQCIPASANETDAIVAYKLHLADRVITFIACKAVLRSHTTTGNLILNKVTVAQAGPTVALCMHQGNVTTFDLTQQSSAWH